MCVIAGEITTSAVIDYNQIARQTIKRIGYDSSDIGFDYNTCSVLVTVGKQSPDIAQGVDRAHDDYLDQGAGDQGLMFGYACSETPVLMPMPIYLAHRLTERQSELRKDGRLPWLRPDAKSQVSIRYVDGKPHSIDTVVLSTQHHPEVSHAQLSEAVIEEIIKPVLPKEMLTADTRYLVNPTGRFVVGGPIVAAGLAGKCMVQVSYAIGVAKPTSLMVDTFGTGKIPEAKIVELIHAHFDLRPKGIVQMLALLRPIYTRTASYGHYGRDEPDFTWEVTDKAAALKAAAGI